MSNAVSINSSPIRPVPGRIAAVQDSVLAWQAGFLKFLPAIVEHAQVEFRHLNAEAREEAVQEVVANAMIAYLRLLQLGKEEVAYASPLARFAVAQYRAGRLVANRLIARRRARLEQERAGFDRWMARLRRAGNEVAKRQKTIARLERDLARLHAN